MEKILSPKHWIMLHDESAISAEVIEARGYFTATRSGDLAELGFASSQQTCAPALVLPVCPPDGSNGLYVIRPDSPRSFDDKRNGRLPDGTYPQKALKYEFPKGASMRLDCPPACRPNLGDPSIPLWITEGQKKADALASQGLCAIDLLGVTCWQGRNLQGGLTALADWADIALNGREVLVVFDSDVMRKPEVQKALKSLTLYLQKHGARVCAVYLPHRENGQKQGVDDFFANQYRLMMEITSWCICKTTRATMTSWWQEYLGRITVRQLNGSSAVTAKSS